MNISNSEHIVSALSNKEMKTLIIALQRFNNQIGPNNHILMCKLVDAYLLSNELEAKVIKSSGPMGVAEGKRYLASI